VAKLRFPPTGVKMRGIKCSILAMLTSQAAGPSCEYDRDLIREDEKRAAREKLKALLVEGIQSSEPTEITRQDWEDIRREALKQFESRKSA